MKTQYKTILSVHIMGVLHRKPKDNEATLVPKKFGKVEFYLTEKGLL